MDPEQAVAAGTRALELLYSLKAVDSRNGTYPPDLIEELWAFYQYGTGIDADPGDPFVTRKVCREFVLGLIWDLFLVEASREDRSVPDTGDFKNPLDVASTELFFDLLARILVTADTDLSFLQRTRLYRVAGLVLTREAQAARSTLVSLMTRENCSGWEKNLIRRALAKIDR